MRPIARVTLLRTGAVTHAWNNEQRFMELAFSQDGDTLHLYYGAADKSMALATGSVREMLAWLDEHSSE